MHERSLVAGLLAEVDRLVAEHAPARATHVTVSVGAFSGVDADLFHAAFEEMSLETQHRGAKLSVERVGLEATCEDCGHEFEVEQFRFRCPKCHRTKTTIIRGEALMLETVTMESLSGIG